MEENEEEIGKGGGKIIAEKGVNNRLVEREGRGREMERKRDQGVSDGHALWK